MNNFASMRVDFGIVVSDLDKAVAFYRDALGMVEVSPFDVPPEMGGESGLSDYKPFHVRVMKIADDPEATQVKLMDFPGIESQKPDTEFIHSSLGVGYLTFYVKDIDAALARAAEHGAPVLANGPHRLKPPFPDGIHIAVVRDPDGNMIEFVGPRK